MSAHNVKYTYSVTENLELEIDPALDSEEKELDALEQLKEELFAIADEGSITVITVEEV